MAIKLPPEIVELGPFFYALKGEEELVLAMEAARLSWEDRPPTIESEDMSGVIVSGGFGPTLAEFLEMYAAWEQGMEELIKIAKEQLKDHLGKSGAILYSKRKTLKPGKAYLLGFNPGGNPVEQADNTIGAALEKLAAGEEGKNEYICGKWTSEKPNHRIQQGVRHLLPELGFRVEDTCASNLIFERSVGEKGVDYQKLPDIFWPVHDAILRLVDPDVILCFGNGDTSPYHYIRYRIALESVRDHEPVASGYSNWKIKAFEASVAGRNRLVVGLPHLSYFIPKKYPAAIEFLKKKLVAWEQTNR